MPRSKKASRPQGRKPEDIIPPERMARADLDRSIRNIDYLFSRAFGQQNAPVRTAAGIAQTQEETSLGDIGCGTGNTLRTWRQAIREVARPMGKVSLTGVSKYDYSRQSAHPATVAACANRSIRYIVADATGNMPVEDASMDVSLAYRAIEHSDDPSGWVERMVRATRPKGFVFFTADTHTQFLPDDPLPKLLHELDFDEPPMLEHAAIETRMGRTVYMTLGRLVVPATGTA